MKVELRLDGTDEIIKNHGLDKSGKAQQFHTANVLRRIQKYMPYRTGAFIKTTIAQTDIRKPVIVTDEPYAKYLFYGVAMAGKAPKHLTEKPLEYTKTKGRKAGKRWDLALKAAEMSILRKELQAYINRGK